MRRKTDAERANINARARLSKAGTMPTISRIVEEELGEHSMEPLTLVIALQAARRIGFRDGVKDVLE